MYVCIGIGIGIGKFIADISVIGISVNFLIGASLVQQTCSDKQHEQTDSYTKKQVYRSLMNNNFT